MATIRKRKWVSGGNERTAWVVDYKDQHGDRRLKTFAKKKEADEFLVTARHEVKEGTHTADSATVTVAEAAEAWIKGRAVEGIERSTLRQYRQHIDLHIVPLIGVAKLSKLTTPKVEQFKETLLETRSRAMARKVLQSFRSIVRDAQRRGLVAHNAAQGVSIRTAKRDKEPVVIPAKDEVRLMLEKAPERWRPLIVTAIFTGLRASELRGLTWDDVDFDARVIRVRQRADRWDDIGPPKSATSRREIPMTPMVVNTLRALRLRGPKGDLNLVFPNGRGHVENLANIWKRCFTPLQLDCGIVDVDGKPKYGLHALRHFYASWLIDQGFTSKKVQTLLGHSSIQMTFDTYGHLFPSLEDDHAKLAAGEVSLVG